MISEKITASVIEAIETGWLPDSIIRYLVRRMCRSRLAALERVHANDPDCGVGEFADRMRIGPIAPVPEKANEQHYEVPSEFFELILGPRLKYSCCHFEHSDSSLADAENRSLELTGQHAELTDGLDVLELGCGWGSLTLWMLEKFPSMRVTAVSNSQSQRQWIVNRAENRGLANRLDVITADMNDFSTERKFDRIISCEMFEHMRNYEQLLSRTSKWLHVKGKLFIHIFCHRRFAYEFNSDGESNWMGRYFFSGGIMPSFNLLDEFDRKLHVTRRWSWDGTHYEKTCNAWLKRLDDRRGQALAILGDTYGRADAERWLQRWRLFLIAGAELFGVDKGRQWMVGHYLMEHSSRSQRDQNDLQLVETI